MKIVYDLRIVEDHMHGMARYALELLRALLARGGDLELGVLLSHADRQELLPDDERLTTWVCSLAPYGPQSQIQLPRLLNHIEPDLYHCPFFGPPVFYNRPMVITLHDLIHVKFPRDYGLKQKLYYRYVVGPAARKARTVFTVSEHSKKDLVRYLGLDPARVQVTYNGAGADFKPLEPGQKEQIKQKYNLPGGYILGVGNKKPHKNLAGLVRAHALLLEQNPQAPELVLVGVGSEDIDAAAPGPRVRCIPHLKDHEMPLYYGASHMVVEPSFYEGFGLPALEAMASGVPVIVSDRASLPEVVGDAGIVSAPEPEALCSAMAGLLADDELRLKLCAAGPKRAAGFTWEAAARKTLETYRRICKAEEA